MSLFCFCFYDLSTAESGMLNSPTIIVWSVMCALSFSKVSFMNVGIIKESIDVQNWEFIFVDFSFDWYEVSFLIFFDKFWLKVDFILY